MDVALREPCLALDEVERLAHAGSWDWDRATDAFTWSAGLDRITGREPGLRAPSRAELRALLTPQSAARLSAATLEALRDATPFELHLEYRRPDGGTVWGRLHGEVRRDGAGQIAGLHGTVVDVNEGRRVADALREQKEFLDTVLESEPECVKVLAPDGRVLRMNRAGLAMLEVESLAEVPPQGLIAFVVPEDRPAFGDVARSVFRGMSRVLQFRIQGKRGTRRLLETHASPLRDTTGAITALVAVTRDITDRALAEEALRSSEQHLEESQQAARVGSYELDFESGVWTSSKVLDNVFGIDEAYPHTVKGWEDLLHPSSRAAMMEYFAATLASQGQFDREYQIVRPGDGVEVWLHGRGTIEYDAAGKPLRMTGTIRDVTERKQAEAHIRQNIARGRVAERLAVQLEIGPMLRAVCEEAAQALLVPTTWINLHDAERGTFVLAEGVGLPDGFREHYVPPTQAFYERHLRQPEADGAGAPVVIPNVQTLTGSPNTGLFAELRLRNAALAPLLDNGRLVGVLNAATTDEAHFFSVHDVGFLKGLADQAVLGIANARLYDEARARKEELGALFSLSTKLRAAHTVGELLPLAVTEVRELLSAVGGAVVLWDPDTERFTVAQGDGLLDPGRGPSSTSGDGVCAHVLQTGRLYVTADYATDPLASPRAPRGNEIGPAAFVPLQSEDEIQGILMIARPRGEAARPFSPADVRLLETCGEMYGTALRRTLLSDQAQERLRFTEALRRIDEAIISSTDKRLALNAVLEEVIAHLGADAAAVLTLDPSFHTLRFAAGRGFRTAHIQRTDLRLDQGHAGQAALERRTIVIPDLSQARPFVREPLVTRERLAAYVAVPLLSKGELLGLLEVFHRRPFEPAKGWLDSLEALAGQAAIAIESGSMFDGLKRSKLELELAYDETIEGWSRALDLRDEETEGHTQRVTEVTFRLCRALGFSEVELVHIRRGALLHDIGKVGVPDSILLKAGPLTEEEWVVMRRHPQYAFELLSPIAYLRPALDIPYGHHEKWDGSGYPRGLAGEQIPRAARAFAVVDVWDALRSDRPYRKGWTEERVREHLGSLAGTHLDPEAVSAFLRMPVVDRDGPRTNGS